MKIRSGFVSNSSSASFIVLGVACSKKEVNEFAKALGCENDFEDEYGEDSSEFFLTKPKGIESLHADSYAFGDQILGQVLADVHSDGDVLDDKAIPLPDLQKKAGDIARALDVDVRRVQLYFGTRSS